MKSASGAPMFRRMGRQVNQLAWSGKLRPALPGRRAARPIAAEVSSALMNRRKVPANAQRLARLMLGASVALWLWFQMMGHAAKVTAGPKVERGRR